MAPNKRGGPPSDETIAVLKGKKPAKGAKSTAAPVADIKADASQPAPYEPNDYASGGAISKAEIEARGTGTDECSDTYTTKRFWSCEYRVFFTGCVSEGAMGQQSGSWQGFGLGW